MLSGMIFVFAPLVVGYLFIIRNPSHLHRLSRATSHLVYVILFLMGLSLAGLDNLQSNLQTIVKYTAVFFVVLGTCNLLVLPLVDRYLPLSTDITHKKVPLSSMMLESAKLILVVGAGLVAGVLLNQDLHWVESASGWILFLLLFFIGIQLRNSGLSLKQILLNKHGMVIAAVIILTSWLGGVIAAWLLDMPIYQALAMASGFGWYSLVGILVGDAFEIAVLGGASFMIELLRELVALVLIPMLIRRKPCTAIGYAGATAMDFTLPVIQTTGGVKCVPVAIVSGFILSLLVPALILFFVSLAS